MALEPINYGAAPNDGTGDSLREAMRKSQANFEYLDEAKVDNVPGARLMTAGEQAKLSGIDTGATNDRSKHTGGFNGYGAYKDMRDGGTGLKASDPPSAFLGIGSVTGLATAAELGLGSLGYGVFQCAGMWTDISAGWGITRSFFVKGRMFVSCPATPDAWGGWIETTDRRNQVGEQGIDTITGLQDAIDSKADKTAVARSIAMAATFAAVPATFEAAVIHVTQPHFRTFVWNGVAYERAPWHRPGVLFFSHAPAANVTHGIQVRADVTYNKADYPDLAEILGAAGATFVLPEGRARVLRAADNGRGIDSALVNGYLQEDAIRNFTGDLTGFSSGVFTDTLLTGGVFGTAATAAETVLRGGPSLAGSGRMTATIDASRQVPTASENRVKSLAATLYITK